MEAYYIILYIIGELFLDDDHQPPVFSDSSTSDNSVSRVWVTSYFCH